ncbi:MAG: hypothetical protein HYV63_28695 [Candidatus Schekmanbacteria bacterium]|nr:hypothetical protein [Candidatus Schekmanbacteria bacterium]
MSGTRISLLLAIALVVVVGASPASADWSSVGCANISSHHWTNADEGDMIVNRTNGIILDTVDALGEYWSHASIAGPKTWDSNNSRWFQYIVHNTAATPPADGAKINASYLKYGWPGAARITADEWYTFLHWGDYDKDDVAQTVTTYNLKHTTLTSSNETLYRADMQDTWDWISTDTGTEPDLDDTASKDRFGGSDVFEQIGYYLGTGSENKWDYRFRRYKAGGNQGTGATPAREGAVCSTTIAYASYRATGDTQDDYSYTDATALHNAAQSLVDGVKDDCNAGRKWYWAFDINACTEAAHQVFNCFIYGSYGANTDCDDQSGGPLDDFLDDSNVSATSLSPDRMVDSDGNTSGSTTYYNSGDRGYWVYSIHPLEDLQWYGDGNTRNDCWY